jgi:hypothetical protein
MGLIDSTGVRSGAGEADIEGVMDIDGRVASDPTAEGGGVSR